MKKRELKARVAELEEQAGLLRRSSVRERERAEQWKKTAEEAHGELVKWMALARTGTIPPMPTTSDLFTQRVERVEGLMEAVDAPPKPAYVQELEAAHRKALDESMGEHPAMNAKPVAPRCLCGMPECPPIKVFDGVLFDGDHHTYQNRPLSQVVRDTYIVLMDGTQHMGCYPRRRNNTGLCEKIAKVERVAWEMINNAESNESREAIHAATSDRIRELREEPTVPVELARCLCNLPGCSDGARGLQRSEVGRPARQARR